MSGGAIGEAWRDIVGAYKANGRACAGLAVILLLALCALAAPLISPYDPYEIDMTNISAAPSRHHPLGTDELGRDMLTRMIYGARISLSIGIIPAIIAQAVGAAAGIIAGWYRGVVDHVIMCIADVVLAFPSTLLALAVMYTLSGSLTNLFIALAIVGWASTARVVRSLTLSIKERAFVEAARATGVRDSVIMVRHILPNCVPTIIVLLTLRIPNYILQEASLSFLGMGAQPPTPSWGLIAAKGKEFLFSAPWIGITPGIFILITVLAFNFAGDGVRDALDPEMKA